MIAIFQMACINIMLVLLWIRTVVASPYLEIPIMKQTTTVDDGGYRLPSNIKPIEYRIELTIPDTILGGQVTEFSGKVDIDFQVDRETSSILLHSPGDIDGSQIILIQVPQSVTGRIKNFTITSSNYNRTTEILTILTNDTLVPGTGYDISIASYTATLDTTEMHGLYRSSYVDENNITQYLVTTQFQPTFARKAFPCFDEPHFKARFALTVDHPNGTIALFNTEGDQQQTE